MVQTSTVPEHDRVGAALKEERLLVDTTSIRNELLSTTNNNKE